MKKLFSLLLILSFVFSFIFADSFMNGCISFNVPNSLEIRSDQYEKIINRIADDAGFDFLNSNDEDIFEVVLQQEGLNIGNNEAESKYCRIKIVVTTDDSMSVPNWLMKEYFASLSLSEKKEYEEMLRSIAEMSIAIIDWYPTTYKNIGGLFAVCDHYTRKSTSGNDSPVEVYSYAINTGIYTITMYCSYRQSQAQIFVPVIKEFLDSLVLNFPENSADIESFTNSKNLYKHNLLGTKLSFLWPESNPTWITIEDNSVLKAKQLMYSSILTEGYLCVLQLIEYKTSLSKYQTGVFLMAIVNESLQTLRNNTSLKNLKIFENSFDNNSARLRYSYTNIADDSVLFGYAYWF
ncbi:MAG: hypothetical protein PHD05_10360, partial [Sphaerochaetaceae bacterium]|nr:hypothetical protein [Sphaerochaetaceae bacterium]